MATVPLSGTNVRLLSGVPFYNDYKDTRWFDTKAAQTAYFLNRANGVGMAVPDALASSRPSPS